MTTRKLSLTLIVADDRYQPREKMQADVIAEYAEQMRSGDVFPPIKVVGFPDGKYRIADGFHRYYAARKLNLKTITAEVIKENGGHLDVLEACVRANHGHGLRRTNEDKRRAIEMIVNEPAYAGKGKKQIAALALVSKTMVIDYLREVNGEMTAYERRKTEAQSQPGKSPARPASQPSGVFNTPTKSTYKLTKAQQSLHADMIAAGISQDQIDAVIARWEHAAASKQVKQPKPRKSLSERLEAIAEKLARSKGVVIELAVKEATPRTKLFVKVPSSLKEQRTRE